MRVYRSLESSQVRPKALSKTWQAERGSQMKGSVESMRETIPVERIFTSFASVFVAVIDLIPTTRLAVSFPPRGKVTLFGSDREAS